MHAYTRKSGPETQQEQGLPTSRSRASDFDNHRPPAPAPDLLQTHLEHSPQARRQAQIEHAINHTPRAQGQAQLQATIARSQRSAAQRKHNTRLKVVSATRGAQNGVLQGYFMLNGQATNDPEQFADGATPAEKEDQVWPSLKAEIERVWQSLPDHKFNAALIDEIRGKLLGMAFNKTPFSTLDVAQKLNAESNKRVLAEEARLASLAESRKELSDRASPQGIGGTLNPTPKLAGKEKHSAASYTRTTTDDKSTVVTEELFSSDDYTKGPARRSRSSKAITTPKGDEEQAWTKTVITQSISAWTCDAPLARHLAGTVWPLLKNSAEGRRWEVKFREIDRLVSHRDDEGMGSSIDILEKATDKKLKTLDRDTYTKNARALMKAAILSGTKHPADQSGVPFYDTLLKAAVDSTWLKSDATGLDLKPTYKVAGSLSMILTHWRTILYFDWILAEDVLNNAKSG